MNKKILRIIIAERRVKILGYFQLIAAIVIFSIFIFGQFGGSNTSVIITLIFAVLLNGCAGYFSIKAKTEGYYLSLINQVLQTFAIDTARFHYSYNGIGAIYVGLQDGIVFGAIIDPSFSIGWGKNPFPVGLSIDLLAIFFIAVLLSAINFTKKTANQTVESTF